MIKQSITACIFGVFVLASSCSSEKASNIDIKPQEPVAVEISRLGTSNTESKYSASGKVQSAMQANLSTRMMGYVQNIYVNLGDRVSKGELLIKLNNKDIRAKKAQIEANITEATAAFNNANKDYKRFQSLFESESASQKELDDVTAHFQMAKARLEGAKQMKAEVNAQMDYTNIRAPFSGVISSKFINEGDLANPGMPLMSIENKNNFEVITMVSESEISKIKQGMDVDVTVKSSNKKIKGKVKEVSASSHQFGSQYQVKISLENCDDLFTGMYTQVQFPISKSIQENLMLPTSILVERGQLKGVFVISQQKTAVLRWLRLGKIIGNEVEVLSGLNAGEQYIVSSKGKLQNGTPLNITK